MVNSGHMNISAMINGLNRLYKHYCVHLYTCNKEEEIMSFGGRRKEGGINDVNVELIQKILTPPF